MFSRVIADLERSMTMDILEKKTLVIRKLQSKVTKCLFSFIKFYYLLTRNRNTIYIS